MDLKKLKGMNWVGNIYQKFEAICQEVDDIVNQVIMKEKKNPKKEDLKCFWTSINFVAAAT